MALSYFKCKKVDLAIIEVGLGGRLDSTNIINSFLSIITNISYDHQNILGNKLINIANEKSGIIKKNSIFIKGEKQNNIDNIFVKKCNKLKTKYIKSYQNVEITSLSKNIFTRKINVKTNNLEFILNIKPPTNYYIKNIPNNITGVLLYGPDRGMGKERQEKMSSGGRSYGMLFIYMIYIGIFFKI